MEVFQNLTVFVPDDKLVVFQQKLLKQALSQHWEPQDRFEADYKKNVLSDEPVICLKSPSLLLDLKQIQAYVWLRHSKGRFQLFNIIPALTRSLSYQEYNFVLGTFYNLVVKGVAKKMDLDAIITAPEKSIEDIIGSDAYNALSRFSKAANKSTGNTNPFDFDRWCDFVFIIHRNDIQLNSDDFSRWLEEDEGWPNELATKLAIDLEYALDILKRYEQYN